MENNTLLKIMSLYWQLFIIPNGIEDSLLPVGLASDIALKKKKRLNTKNEDTSKTHGMPFDTCFGKSSESEPFWICFFPSEVGGMPSLATVSNFVFYNLLPQDSLGFFFSLKTLNVLLKICIHFFPLHNNTKRYNHFCK